MTEQHDEPVACDLGPMHGMASTHVGKDGATLCDFCGHPVATRPTPSSDMVASAYRYVHYDYAGRKVSSYGAYPERINGHDPIEAHPLYDATVIAEAMAANDAQPAELRAEIEALRGELTRLKAGQWFYLAGDMSSDRCRFSPSEVIDEDWLYDNRAEGSAVVHLEVATPLPDIWCAVRFFTNEEKDARQSDDDYELTEHASEEDARAALGSAEG